MNRDPRQGLRAALNPRSIAVIGASDNANKIGGRPLAFLKRFGFKGKVYPVNPTRDQVQGLRCWPDFSALPEVPDAVVIAVPGEQAVEAVRQCATAGVSVAVVMASGFGETADPKAIAQERQMVQAARSAGMRIVGPNSQGLANFGTGAVPNFSTMFVDVPAADGPVGIISQSGAMSVIPYGLLRARGVGVRHVHATGNDADVTACELATVVVEDPELKLLLLYLEGLPDPWNLAQAARIARQRGLPIIALKSGRSAAGAIAAASHTGALAGEDRVVDAFLRDQGIWRVASVNEMVEMAELYLKGWKPRGRRLVAISNSGAVCVMTADAATDAGLELAPLSEPTQTELKRILPGFATTRNPVDITAALLGNSSLFGAILPVIARDEAADAFFIGIAVAGPGYDVPAFAKDSAQFAAQTGKPLVVAASQPSVAQHFAACGVSVYSTEAIAIGALGRYLSHSARLSQATEEDCPGPSKPSPEEPVLRTGNVQALDEAQSLALIARQGVAVVPFSLCHNEAQVREAFASLGASSVVVKGCSARAPHKSELGLVRIGLSDPDAAALAYHEVLGAGRDAGIELDGVLVATRMRGMRELMVGARIDPVFGPVLIVGDGGKYVEAMPDVAVVLAPFTVARIERALRSLRIAPLLDGVRGEPAMDMEAFCQAAASVGRLVCDPTLAIESVDVNPVIVGPRGEGCVAVDALVHQYSRP
jgi:acetate---CoA ligase (ADP-forming)